MESSAIRRLALWSALCAYPQALAQYEEPKPPTPVVKPAPAHIIRVPRLINYRVFRQQRNCVT